MTGMALVISFDFNSRAASKPFMSGRRMSMRMRSGRCARAAARPSRASTAVVTWWPARVSRRESMSRFNSLSSTSKILATSHSFGVGRALAEDVHPLDERHRPQRADFLHAVDDGPDLLRPPQHVTQRLRQLLRFL